MSCNLLGHSTDDLNCRGQAEAQKQSTVSPTRAAGTQLLGQSLLPHMVCIIDLYRLIYSRNHLEGSYREQNCLLVHTANGCKG